MFFKHASVGDGVHDQLWQSLFRMGMWKFSSQPSAVSKNIHDDLQRIGFQESSKFRKRKVPRLVPRVRSNGARDDNLEKEVRAPAAGLERSLSVPVR
jgi:hypothetical protein